MKKREELHSHDSCYTKAHDQEMIFVLLSRDKCAAKAIRFWAEERIKEGLNQANDSQIQDALACAKTMDEETDKWKIQKKIDAKVHQSVSRFQVEFEKIKKGVTDLIREISTPDEENNGK